MIWRFLGFQILFQPALLAYVNIVYSFPALNGFSFFELETKVAVGVGLLFVCFILAVVSYPVQRRYVFDRARGSLSRQIVYSIVAGITLSALWVICFVVIAYGFATLLEATIGFTVVSLGLMLVMGMWIIDRHSAHGDQGTPHVFE